MIGLYLRDGSIPNRSDEAIRLARRVISESLLTDPDDPLVLISEELIRWVDSVFSFNQEKRQGFVRRSDQQN